MPTKRNRNNSESSNCSVNGVTDDQNGSSDFSNFTTNGAAAGNAEIDLEVALLRPCCTPIGCLLGGQVNLTESDEIDKIICSNENCTAGPYMHKECFNRWEDGLLTYLRSHGRARSWSEKQRRQNLWTKRGYDLAYRACTCICNRGHLRKDLNWNPQDVVLPCTVENPKKVAADDGAKKKNRKKHKDLPALGNKYTFGAARSKSRAIPNGKDNRVRTSSTSSVLSVDLGYSSSSPSNSEIHGGGFAFFSPPQNSGRNHLPPSTRAHSHIGFRNGISHGLSNPFLSHSTLPEIPDNDVLDFYGEMASIYDPAQSPVFSPDTLDVGGTFHMKTASQCHIESMKSMDGDVRLDANMKPQPNIFQQMQQPLHDHQQPMHDHQQPLHDHRFDEISKMMQSMGISKLQPLPQQDMTWNNSHQHPPIHPNMQSPPQKPFDPSTMLSVNLLESDHADIRPGIFSDMLHENNIKPFIGHWNPDQTENRQSMSHSLEHIGHKKGQCRCLHELPPNKVPEPHPFLSLQDFPETASSMLCSDIDLKKPKVIIIPGERDGTCGGATTCTEICITPMCSTVFNKRYDFRAFQKILRRHQVNPYHIKMEGEGYGSDDFRNSILSKLSRAKCSQMNCVFCGKDLPIFDHFPLLDGTMFLSPLRNEDRTRNELKIEVENKSEYLHAVCMGCLEGVNVMFCRMCESRWQGSFHQLGSLYMYDVFAAAPCCQSRLCCKRCGVAIVDRHVGMKFYSEYSRKMTCPSCGSIDYHFVHPASTYKVLGPDKFPYF